MPQHPTVNSWDALARGTARGSRMALVEAFRDLTPRLAVGRFGPLSSPLTKPTRSGAWWRRSPHRRLWRRVSPPVRQSHRGGRDGLCASVRLETLHNAGRGDSAGAGARTVSAQGSEHLRIGTKSRVQRYSPQTATPL